MPQQGREKGLTDSPHPSPSVQPQAARSHTNALTPRTRREGGGAIRQPQRRVSIAELMRHEMLCCPVETFLNHYAPFSLSPDTMDYVYKEIEKECLVDVPEHLREPPAEDGLGWAAFDGGGPSDFAGTEQVIFGKLEEIMEVLQGLDPENIYSNSDEPACGDNEPTPPARLPPRQLNFRYKDSPYSKVVGEREGSQTFMVDACLRPKHADQQKIFSSEAAVIAEFKLHTQRDDVQKNRRQLVSTASYIMNEDPCRMWMYGITIEDNDMSLWYFSRSHSVKSETFDWTRDFKTFAQVFISFMFATTQEMGFDPTVHRVEVNKQIQYIYQVHNRFFLTVEPIFNPRVLCISGRKTRVWRAVEVCGPEEKDFNTPLNNGKDYAIKDVWLDEGSDTEGMILCKIFDALKMQTAVGYEWMGPILHGILSEALDKQNFREYFMEIICDVQGETSKPPAKEAVTDPGILDTSAVEQTEEEVIEKIRTGSSQIMKTSSHLGLAGSRYQPQPPPSRDYVAKRQYRLVYKDVGIPLHDAPNLRSCFETLHDALIALILLTLAKWVHRDISTGNIILLQDSDGKFRRGKLSDLEYAKEFSHDPIGSKDPKTGTPYFIPYEIHAGDRIHAEKPEIDHLTRDRTQGLIVEASKKRTKSRQLFYRHEHDIESLWWIVVWIVLTRILHDPAQKLSQELFTYTPEPSRMRREIFTTQGHASIEDAMPSAVTQLGPLITAMHKELYSSYSVDHDELKYLQIHFCFWDLVARTLDLMATNKISNLTFSDPESGDSHTSASLAPTGEKRQREDDDGDVVQEENTDGEAEASGSRKRPRIE